jgi:hypothetical protein
MVSPRSASLVLTAWFLCCGPLALDGATQEGELRDEAPPIPVEEIIERFSTKESEFRRARANYVYRRDIQVEELDVYTDRVIGEFRLVSDIGFEPDGVRRTEKIIYAPPNSMPNLQLTPEDMRDMDEIQPFVLATEDLHLYDTVYVGKQKIDEIDNYVFDVEPSVIEEGERYFQGRIWVDDLDLQIVKTYGKAVPDIDEQLFPHFETYRQQIDGYWFPTYIRALETLNFPGGALRMRQVIRYENYRRFEADVTFTLGDEVEEEPEPEVPEPSPQR